MLVSRPEMIEMMRGQLYNDVQVCKYLALNANIDVRVMVDDTSVGSREGSQKVVLELRIVSCPAVALVSGNRLACRGDEILASCTLVSGEHAGERQGRRGGGGGSSS
jgi:hypothetical protein